MAPAPWDARRFTLALTAGSILVAGLLPVLVMLGKSLWVDGHPSLVAYQQLLDSPRQWTLMAHSLVLAGLVTLLAMGLGVPLGLLLGRTDLPGCRWFTVLFVIPLLLPPYLPAVAWADLLAPEGPVARLLGPGVATEASRLLFGLPGCVFVLTSTFIAIPLLLTLVFLRTLDPHLEEAARLQSPWSGVIRGITLPLVLPGILLAALLVFLLSLGEFSVPDYLRFAVYPVESFVQFSAFYDFRAATAAALPLLVITLGLLVLEAAFLQGRTVRLHLAPTLEPAAWAPLGRWRPSVTLGVTLLGLVLVVLPLSELLHQAGGPASYVLALHQAGDALLRSLAYAAAGATAITLLGFLCAYAIQSRALRHWRALDALTLFLFTLPGTVIGIGLIGLWNTHWTAWVYASPAIVVLGYLAKYTALGSRIALVQLDRIPVSMEEAAQVAGAGWFRRTAWITVPMAWRGLAGAWLVGYFFSLRDTGISLLVYPPGQETLPVRIFTLMANGSPRLVAALCVLMILVTLVPAVLLGLPLRRGS